MDKTLREYLSFADEAHDYVDKFGIAISIEKLDEKVQQLQASIKNIQSIAKRMADVSNIINQVILYRKNILPTNKIVSKKKYIDPYPQSTDHATLRMNYPDKSNSTEIKLPSQTIILPTKTVEKIEDIPINHLYYVSSLKQYAINIEGLILKGCLSNIVDYQTQHTSRCDYGIKCKSLLNKSPCNYYHEPEDYIKLNLPIPEHTRNFTIVSYLYSRNKRPKTYFTRHIGSKDMLECDLNKLHSIQYREEVSNREGQLIHDLLIYLILHNKGLLERYPHWLKI